MLDLTPEEHGGGMLDLTPEEHGGGMLDLTPEEHGGGISALTPEALKLNGFNTFAEPLTAPSSQARGCK